MTFVAATAGHNGRPAVQQGRSRIIGCHSTTLGRVLCTEVSQFFGSQSQLQSLLLSEPSGNNDQTGR